jgi:hypothetical protein
LPFIREFYFNKKPKYQVLTRVMCIPFAFVVCLSGPLNPGIILVFALLVMLPLLYKNYLLSSKKAILHRLSDTLQQIPANCWYYLLPIGVLSLYSLFLGRYNSITIDTQIPLAEMYLKLPQGIYYQFTQKLGWPLLFVALALNSVIIHRKFKDEEGKKFLRLLKWIGLFSLMYILLLPLGGYRDYRPNVLRYDTIMPITLALIFYFGITSLFLLKNLSNKSKRYYIPFVITVLLLFTLADESRFDQNACEKSALEQISTSTDSIIALDQDCTVLAWGKLKQPEDSELMGQLLLHWGITKEKKLYFNR